MHIVALLGGGVASPARRRDAELRAAPTSTAAVNKLWISAWVSMPASVTLPSTLETTATAMIAADIHSPAPSKRSKRVAASNAPSRPERRNQISATNTARSSASSKLDQMQYYYTSVKVGYIVL